MAKLTLPKDARGLYLQHRVRADGRLLFRWGHAPRLRDRGIRPFDLFADGRPLTSADLAALGLPEGSPVPLHGDGRPMLFHGKAEPLAMKDAIRAARQLKDLLDQPVQSPDTQKAGHSRPGGRNSHPSRPASSATKQRAFTVGDLIEDFFRPASNPKLYRREDKTVASYRSWRAPVDEIFRDEPCHAMTEDLIEDWFHTMKADRGHRMAYGAYQLLRRAWNWGRKTHRLHELIWSEIDTPKPPMKLRIGTEDELAALLRACDDPAGLAAELGLNDPAVIPPARPELGDSIVLAVWTVQRAADVLAFTDYTIRSGRFRFITSKNDQKPDIPITGPILKARLSALKARRQARGASCTHLVLHPTQDAPYGQKKHGDHFREARALAARLCPSLLGEGTDDWGQPIKSFTFEDCRDTGITRLLRAGCSIEQVASWSNHKDLNALRALASSYLDLTGEVSDQAGTLLEDHYGSKGIAV